MKAKRTVEAREVRTELHLAVGGLGEARLGEVAQAVPAATQRAGPVSTVLSRVYDASCTVYCARVPGMTAACASPQGPRARATADLSTGVVQSSSLHSSLSRMFWLFTYTSHSFPFSSKMLSLVQAT